MRHAALALALAACSASAQLTPLEVNLYADIDGDLVGPGETRFIGAGGAFRYVLVAELGKGTGLPILQTVTIDLVPFNCGGDGFVTNFQYGDWADTTAEPFIAGGAVFGIEASYFGFVQDNPVEICSFDVDGVNWINVYTAEGTGPDGQAFTVGFTDVYDASVFAAPRIIAVGGPGKGGPCSEADMAEPYGVHDLADIQRFVQRFTAGSCRADLRAPWGVIDLADLQAYIISFQDGCTN